MATVPRAPLVHARQGAAFVKKGMRARVQPTDPAARALVRALRHLAANCPDDPNTALLSFAVHNHIKAIDPVSLTDLPPKGIIPRICVAALQAYPSTDAWIDAAKRQFAAAPIENARTGTST